MLRDHRPRQRSTGSVHQWTCDLDTPRDPPDERDGPAPKAVAVRYEPDAGTAPRVVAKGEGTLAEQILEIAFAHGVKVREDADLVEILSAVEVDSEIPLEAFAAVAEILCYVYRANAAARGEGAAR